MNSQRPADRIVCVYCKTEKPRPARGEHIVLKGLGGRATISEVCAECNGLLDARVDREFLRSTHIALHRFFDPAVQDGEVASPQFLPTEYGYLDVRLMNSGEMDLLPQAAAHDSKVVVIAAEPDQQLADAVLAQFRREAPTVRQAIRDVGESDPPRLVIDRKLKSHLLRARTQQAADSLLAALRKGVEPGPYANWEAPRSAPLRISTDLNVVGRCAAKMAFNMATAVLGPQVTLKDDFDGVRAYILGSDVLAGPAIAESGEQGIRVDYRFVDPWIDPEARPQRRGPSDTHTILLGVIRGRSLGAKLSLFGGAEQFTVRLTPGLVIGATALPFALWRRADADWWMPLNHSGKCWRHGEKPFSGVGWRDS